MLLSDLEVHKEQMDNAALYFDRGSPTALADAIVAFTSPSKEDRDRMVDEGARIAEQRLRQFGDEFVKFSHRVMQESAR
jgi:hypothetical protein